MIPFLDVVNNWGDFAARVPNPFKESYARGGGQPIVGLDSSRAVEMEQYTGMSAYDDREPGMRSAERTRARYMERWGKRVYEARLNEVMKMTLKAFRGSKRDMVNFSEAMSISDFPNLFGDVIDRAVLANYLETPYTWNLIAHQASVSDFRPVRRFRVDGGTGILASISAGITGVDSAGALTPLDMGAQYPEDSLSDAQYTYRLFKVGKR